MKAIKSQKRIEKKETKLSENLNPSLDTAISKSWSKIAPFWPLKNLIAVNPTAGFEDLQFEEALRRSKVYFQQRVIPEKMHEVNRISIKWLQAFFDEGQSTIQMPLRHLGLLKSTLSLIRFDYHLHKRDRQKQQWLKNLSQNPKSVISEALSFLGILDHEQEEFLTLLLTTLPGWASHIQYLTKWSDENDASHLHPVTKSEYLAFRLVIICLVWSGAKQLLDWHNKAMAEEDVSSVYKKIYDSEVLYQKELIKKLGDKHTSPQGQKPDAQFVFCIDVRSEPYRRALESEGNYETFGFAGFFGLPVSIENSITGESHASCPVLLKPVYHIVEKPNGSDQLIEKGQKRIEEIKKLYQSLKYTFTTPFSLVETLGLPAGLWMGFKTFAPAASRKVQLFLKRIFLAEYSVSPDIRNIPLEKQVAYAIQILQMMGLTQNFASVVILCGHESTTQNNAYATALDCGACGGHQGSPNARILASILNSHDVRKELKKLNLIIPKGTLFLAANHNTTTDEIEIYDQSARKSFSGKIDHIRKSLKNARNKNSIWRICELGEKIDPREAKNATVLRSKDWAEVRPEWGLAKNASFIVGPRWFTKSIDLEGRSFLHSYEWEKDVHKSSLTTILTAPMVVAQWINAQYLFSTIDNIAFGGGSKITQNITGKIGVMQGNASDLMHGLSLQSVFRTDKETYHQPLRLTVLVYAPKSHINWVINEQQILKKLFGNGWIHLICYDPIEKEKFILSRDFTWSKLH